MNDMRSPDDHFALPRAAADAVHSALMLHTGSEVYWLAEGILAVP
ncbi:MAG: hypothetical protein U0974_01075 [Gemmatimonadales bacterium]|nr:hypothetical protein [Gemmatimonadales bacterium]MDZ4388308.1 hypothetical protein [Gemmatimonadales bacterium]